MKEDGKNYRRRNYPIGTLVCGIVFSLVSLFFLARQPYTKHPAEGAEYVKWDTIASSIGPFAVPMFILFIMNLAISLN